MVSAVRVCECVREGGALVHRPGGCALLCTCAHHSSWGGIISDGWSPRACVVPPLYIYGGCVWVLVAVACVSNNTSSSSSSLNTHASTLSTYYPTLVVVVHSGGGVCCGGGGGACAQVWETAVGECVLVIASIFFPPLLLSVALHCLVCVCVCFAYYTNAKHTHTQHTHKR